MAERKTITFTTQNGLQVELKEYITGGEYEEWQKVILKGMQVDTSDPRSSKIDATVSIEQLHKAIELIVVSIDGNNQDILNQVKELPRDDYQSIVNRVQEIVSPKVEAPGQDE
jgi:hypothetical protein